MTTTENPSTDLTRTVVRAVRRRSVLTLATVSPAGRPHAATVLYAAVGPAGGMPTFYAAVDRSSRKARNIAATPHVGVTVAIRRLPVGPPATVQFQGTADVLAVDDPEVLTLAASGDITAVTSHGELERPDACLLRIRAGRRLHTFGLGMSLWALVRDPLNAEGHVDLGPAGPIR